MRQRSRNSSSVDPEPSGEIAERLEELPRRVGLVPGRHRRVRREDGAAARRLERLVDRRLRARPARAAISSAASAGMALVEVDDGGLDPERSQHPHAADPEQRRTAPSRDRPVALVQPRGRPARDGVVLRHARCRAGAAARGPTSTRQTLEGDSPRRRRRPSSRNGAPSGARHGPSAALRVVVSQYSCWRPERSRRCRK